MTTIANIENRVQAMDARVMGLVKTVSLVVTTGTGAGVTVRGLLFANWEGWVASLVGGSVFGMVLVATLATMVSFVLSVWLCAKAGCFTAALTALTPAKKETVRRGAAARARRASRVASYRSSL